MRSAWCLGLLVALTACHDDAVAPSFGDASVRVLDPVAWPGGAVRVASQAFVGLDSLPVVRADTFTLVASRLDDTTIVVRMPVVSATMAFRVSIGADTRFGSVRTVGMLRADATAPMRGWPMAANAGDPIVTVASDSSVLLFNMASRSAQALTPTHISECSVSVGFSYRAASIVTQGTPVPANSPPNCGRPKAWVLAPTAAVADSGPSGNGDRHWDELSPGLWLRGIHHDVLVSGPGINLTYHVEDNERLIVSPNHQLAALATLLVTGGLPVIRTSDGSLAFRIGLSDGTTLAWSPAGDTLFAFGRATSSSPAPRLFAFSGSDGSLLHQGTDSLDDGDTGDLLPVGPFLYATVFGFPSNQATGPHLRVYDRHTFAAVGQVMLDGAVCLQGCQVLLGAAPALDRVYLLAVPAWMQAGSPGRVYTIETPPAVQVPVEMTP